MTDRFCYFTHATKLRCFVLVDAETGAEYEGYQGHELAAAKAECKQEEPLSALHARDAAKAYRERTGKPEPVRTKA